MLSPFGAWSSEHSKLLPLEKMKRLRDKCFAHWDPDVFKDFAKRLAQENGEPALETLDGKFLESRYLWPLDAIGLDLLGDPRQDPTAAQLAHDLGKLWTTTANLLSNVLAELIKKYDLKPEPVDLDES